MMMRIASIAVCVVLAATVAVHAQTDAEEDGAVDLNAIDSLLSDQIVTGDQDGDDDATAEDAVIAGSDVVAAGEEEPAEDEAPPEPSDLTLAFNAYSLCASEAGAALEETGFALDTISREALLRCSGQRAAYVNAFYFSLLPRYPDSPEADVRASAERLVAQSDVALAMIVTDEVTSLRDEREADAADESEAEETDTAEDSTPDDEIAEEETEPNA
ncbi:hypothetical protein HFP57_11360 [Parasphingopyxis algicola]|uniref:hypothetical protein n=1 Tax=Parasphingopyxis algicola TaxID=2026624 RepID=UPI0015A23623|nr:hypothetical protein [Parasphingopyxis algicola]QLC25556.1 hypothetical protein HFP57_11360 [Parasphingopyxis algicola]